MDKFERVTNERAVLFGSCAMVALLLVGFVVFAGVLAPHAEQARELDRLAQQRAYIGEALGIRLTAADETLDSSGVSPWTSVRRADQPIGRALKFSAPEAYNETIELAIGIDEQLRVVKLICLRHRETPGYGEKVLRNSSDWLAQFADQSLLDIAPESWALTSEGGVIDGVTGATITANAVVNAVASIAARLRQENDKP